MNPEVMKALVRGGGLTAADYAGLTPEQMQALFTRGREERMGIASILDAFRGRALEERKLDIKEQTRQDAVRHQEAMLNIAQQKELRESLTAEFDILDKITQQELAKKKFDVNKKYHEALGAKHLAQANLLKDELDMLETKRIMYRGLSNKMISVPDIHTIGPDGKLLPTVMSLRDLHLMGLDGVLPDVIKGDPALSAEMQKLDFAMRQGLAMDMTQPEAFIFAVMMEKGLEGASIQELAVALANTTMGGINFSNDPDKFVKDVIKIHKAFGEHLLQSFRPKSDIEATAAEQERNAAQQVRRALGLPELEPAPQRP